MTREGRSLRIKPALYWPTIQLNHYVIAWVIATVAITTWTMLQSTNPRVVSFFDIGVYTEGARQIVQGNSLYDFDIDGYPFTYPPISGYVFLPAVFVHHIVARVVITVLSLACLARIVWLLARPNREVYTGSGLSTRLHTSAQFWTQRIPTWHLFIPLLCWYPIFSTLAYGQINLFLLWLVCEDVFRLRHTRFGGILLGIAAAIKLTPLFLVGVFFWATWQLFALRAAGTFFAVGALGFALNSADSIRFWTKLINDASRVGDLGQVFNQSLNGLVWRLLGSGGSSVVWMALSAACGVACIIGARRFALRGNAVGSLAVASLGMLLVSPVSWVHHWVWIMPAIACVIPAMRPAWTFPTMAIFHLACVVTVLHAVWSPFHRIPKVWHNPWPALASMLYLGWGIACLIWLIKQSQGARPEANRAARGAADRDDRADETLLAASGAPV